MSAPVAATPAAAPTGTPDAVKATPEAAVAAAAPTETTPASKEAAKPAEAAPADAQAKPFLGEPEKPAEGEKVDPAKKEEPKAEEKKPEPAKFELKLTDELKAVADPKLLEEYSALAQEAKLDSEQASKLAAWHLQKHQSAVQADIDSWKRRGDDWAKQLADDPDFGGKNIEASREAVTRAWVQFSTPEERKVVQDLGLENFPPFVKLFRRIGLATKEDSSATPKGGAPPKPKGSGRLDYPSMDDQGKPIPGYRA